MSQPIEWILSWKGGGGDSVKRGGLTSEVRQNETLPPNLWRLESLIPEDMFSWIFVEGEGVGGQIFFYKFKLAQAKCVQPVEQLR